MYALFIFLLIYLTFIKSLCDYLHVDGLPGDRRLGSLSRPLWVAHTAQPPGTEPGLRCVGVSGYLGPNIRLHFLSASFPLLCRVLKTSC